MEANEHENTEGGILFLLAFGHERSRTPPSTRANAHERASLSRSTTSATPRDEPAAVYEINKYALAREREGEIWLVG